MDRLMSSTSPTILASNDRSADVASPGAAMNGCAFLLIFTVVFQKFAVPGTAGGVAFALVALAAMMALFLARNALRIAPASLLFAAVFFASTAVSISLARSTHLSIPSWFYALVAQAPLVFVLVPGSVSYRQLLGLVSNIGCVVAVLCGVQTALQASVGSGIAFWLDFHIPSAIAQQGFHNLNTLTWDSNVYKANGIFFSEPSFCCQFLGLCILAELSVGARAARLLLMAAGIALTYSGTGLMTLALFLPFYLPPAKRIQVLSALALFGLVAVSVGSVLHLDIIASRVDEFGETNTSGYARFISPFVYLPEVLGKDAETFLFGRGPGTVTEYFSAQQIEVFAPTYAKILYEYGAVGFATYLAFFYSAVLSHRTALSWPMAFTYFLLGGYLQDSSIVTMLLVLGGWSSRQPDRRCTTPAPADA
jgi:hypothetical protein